MSWTETTLAEAPIEIIDGDRGKNYPTQNELLDEGYCLFLSATNVTKDGFAFDKCQFITEQKDEALRKGRVRRNDVVLTTRGTLGNVAYYSNDVPFEHVRINSGMVTIQAAQEELSPRYLYYYLKSDLFQAQVRALQSGAAQPQLPIRDIKKIKISYPDTTTQGRIAEVVGAYDDLIENNRRRIALLEEAARLLYREWFVHFRFPGHEHVKIVNGVPEGWEIKKVGDLLARVKAKTKIRKDEYLEEGDYPCVDQGQNFIGGYTDNLEAIYRDELPLIVFGDHTRALKFVDFPFARGADGTQICQSNDERLSQEMFYWALVNVDLSNYFYARHFKFLKDQEVIIPSQPLADDFTRFARNNFRQVKALRQQSAELAKARDLLLPRLMDGRLEV
jgi:type I restriction enzyme S subunit